MSEQTAIVSVTLSDDFLCFIRAVFSLRYELVIYNLFKRRKI
jgi:hypothetical protein